MKKSFWCSNKVNVSIFTHVLQFYCFQNLKRHPSLKEMIKISLWNTVLHFYLSLLCLIFDNSVCHFIGNVTVVLGRDIIQNILPCYPDAVEERHCYHVCKTDFKFWHKVSKFREGVSCSH